jgi:ATP-binding cassette subfamily B protein
LGYVPQDPALSPVRARHTSAPARPAASDAEIVAAARAAHADGFIRELPQGYATPVGDRGAHLSGGQRQRIALARAILLRPDLYVFDEATSMLDTESERLVQQSIGALAETATVVVIAHRLSTIRHADTIYRLAEDGRAWPVHYEELVGQTGAGA